MLNKIPLALMFLALNAQADTTLERLCFANAQQARQAIPILDTVLVKGQDEISLDGACLNIRVEEKRAEVFQRWVSLRLPHATNEFSSAKVPAVTCNIQVGKRVSGNQKGEIVQIDTTTVSVQGHVAANSVEEVSSFTLLSGRSGMIIVENRQVDITCTLRASGKYQVRIALKPLPQPTTVALGIPPTAKNEMSLSTEVEATAGVDVPLGQLVQDLANKEASVSLPDSAQASQRVGVSMTMWWLKIR